MRVIIAAVEGIEPLAVLDVVAREGDHVPPVGLHGLLAGKSHPCHGTAHLALVERGAYAVAYKLDDAGGGEELARLVLAGTRR